MKSTVTEAPCKKETKYPCLMRNIDNSRIVLFYRNKCGTPITNAVNSDRSYKIGQYADMFRMDDYELFTGSVCLENGDD